ncbi:MAG: hypothetical protein H7Z41_09695 [Cytophagales bacterium]|nr:hypothetical protein [Armatimonadota bacterium]
MRTDLSQKLSSATASGSENLPGPTSSTESAQTEPEGVPARADRLETTAAVPPPKRKPLQFEPEPAQRMVVVRRRSRRRRRKEDKTEKVAGRIRLVLFGVVIVLLLVAVSGQYFAMALLEQIKETVRPLKTYLNAPKLEVLALILAALILLYMMPGVESTVRRWLGIGRKSNKTR